MTPQWEERFLQLAHFVSRWSKDPDAQVGAVVALERGGAIALGYNGFPAGVEDSAERLQDQAIKLELVVHAEQNALLIAGQGARGATMFVAGKPVCAQCAGVIIQAGVAKVVAPNPNKFSEDSKWRKKGELAVQMLKEARVALTLYDP
jgi:dCMP deaminase